VSEAGDILSSANLLGPRDNERRAI